MVSTGIGFRKRRSRKFTELGFVFGDGKAVLSQFLAPNRAGKEPRWLTPSLAGKESGRVIVAGSDDSPYGNAGFSDSAIDVSEVTAFARMLPIK